ncbi:cytochrome c oxidase subunit 3 [Marinimicrobium locisalis]|uniref:cytochrome c oxidase subunit 3 n=1 Tax=Marinimicrobium locisalis TaxID=546022 RepID=UPI003221E66F
MATNDVAHHFDNAEQQARAVALGIWVFLATELLLFGGLFSAFIVLKVQHTEVFSEAATHLSLFLGTLNTAILLTSGLTIFLTEQALHAQRRTLAIGLLAATAFLGCAFIGVKGYEWHHEYQQALLPVLDVRFHYPGSAPEVAELFFNFYYIMTGLHVVHMLVGLGLLAGMGVAVIRWRQPKTLNRRATLIALYWAFVDIIWVVLFSLLYLQGA